MKLQNLTIIFIIIIIPVILLLSLYITTGLKTIRYQALYDTGLITATQDAIQAFEINTLNNQYSENPETKRSIIKASVKMFETSLCNTCNISSYNKDEIEEYIPAVMFGMYDGFYLYTPSYNPTTQRYEHSLKNYVYYSEMLNEENGIIIRYYLDSYVQVSGYFDGTYETKEGYLINTTETEIDNVRPPAYIRYYDKNIDVVDKLAVNYFLDNYDFSIWFQNNVIGKLTTEQKAYLEITSSNDPEDPNSAFVQHRNGIIKRKIEEVLNSSITAYSNRTWGQNYKMPELSEEDWEKIYSDISVTTFFQGKRIGLTKYNGYCVLNSTNNYEYVNPNLLYFATDDDGNNEINTDTDYYHDIRCTELPDSMNLDIGTGTITTIRGYKIGRFQKLKKTVEADDITTTQIEGTTQIAYNKDYEKYMYERAECACYECINDTVKREVSVYDYIKVNDGHGSASEFIKSSYWTSLARERAKVHNNITKESDISVEKYVSDIEGNIGDPLMIASGGTVKYTIEITNRSSTTDTIRQIIDNYDTNKIDNLRVFSYTNSTGTLRVSNPADINTDPETPISKDSIQYPQDADITSLPENLSGKVWNFADGIVEGLAIGAGETITITYTATVTGSENEVIPNTVYVIPGYSNEYEEYTAKCQIRETKIALNKSVTADKIGYGEKVTYKVTVTNNGEYNENIAIRDFWEDSIEPIGTVSPTPNKTNGKEYIWYYKIQPGQTIEIEFEARIKGNIGSPVTNNVSVYIAASGENLDAKTPYKTAEANTTVTKKITTRGSASGYQVTLVLDRSASMVNDYNNVYNAAKELIDGVGAENVKIVAFSQNATVINNIDQYKNFNIENFNLGISTNYLGGLSKARGFYDQNKNNYMVFMSDGAPTNNQLAGYSENNEQPTWLEFLAVLPKGIWNLLNSIYGGWLELLWENENTYTSRLLVTSFIPNFTIPDNVVSRTVWTGTIMPYVEDLKNKFTIYTVYFNTDSDNKPFYGLKRMATDTSKAYHSKNADELRDHFREILESIKNLESDKEKIVEAGIILVDNYEKLDAIQVGSTIYQGEDLEKIKEYLRSNGGNLDLNNFELNGNKIFRSRGDIIFLYRK